MTGQLVWIITGTSSGIGRELAIAALRRGEKVIATARARSVHQLADLKEMGADILELDVTIPLDEMHKVAERAMAIHGRIDVVVNNACSFIAVGAIEELTPEETYNQFNNGFFSGINVARAFLPYMRKARTGKIIWIGSMCGWQADLGLGIYVAHKYAMRGLSETLDIEISPFGLRSICIEPGYFRSKFIGNRLPYNNRIEDYKQVLTERDAIWASLDGNQPGDTLKLVSIVVDIVRGEGFAEGRPLHRSMQIGNDTYHTVKLECETALARLEEWKDVISTTDVQQ